MRHVLFMGCAAETGVAGVEKDKLDKGIKTIYRHLATPLVI
jgi:hypothetical protein